MSKFKAGDKVFSIQHGVVTLEANSWGDDEDLYVLQAPKGEAYTTDGRLLENDLHPSLYTLDEARRMGFPVPTEPVVFEATAIAWQFMPRGEVMVSLADLGEAALSRKRVRVTVEVVE